MNYRSYKISAATKKIEAVPITATSFHIIENVGTKTVAQIVEELGFGWFQIKLSLWTGLFWMTDSMELTLLSLLPFLADCGHEHHDQSTIANLQQSNGALLTSSVFIAMTLSSYYWRHVTVNYGKRNVLRICASSAIFFSFLSSIVESIVWFFFCRVMVGIALGCVPQSVALYSEFLPTKQKPKCVVLLDCFWTLGSCFQIILSFITLQVADWHWILILSNLPFMFFIVISPLWPESPKYHLRHENESKALKTLRRVAEENAKPLLVDTKLSVAATQNETNSTTESHSTANNIRLGDLLKCDGYRQHTLNIWSIWFLCTFCYYGMVLMTPQLLTNSSSSGGVSMRQLQPQHFIDLLWISIGELPGIFLALKLIDWLGPKKSLISLLSLHSITFFILRFRQGYETLTLSLGRAITAGIFQAILVLTPDLFPSDFKPLAVKSATLVARFGAILTPFMAQVPELVTIEMATVLYGLLALAAALCSFQLPRYLDSTSTRILSDWTNE